MKESTRRPPGTHAVRGPGSYTPKACSVCRHKKIKCDGGKPICESCVSGGRADECVYGKGAGRRPRSEGHYQTLCSRISLLFKYAHHLESLLDQCQREHAGSLACGYRQHRPECWEDPESPDVSVVEVVEEEDSENSEVANELCLPTQNLRLAEEGGLLLHGATAPFRYISESMRPPMAPGLWALSGAPNESYTLLVDGSDEACFDPNFDWSRHLPPEVHMDRRGHDKILDLVFKFYTSWCLRIVPPLFLRDMYRALKIPRNQTPPRLSHYSPMLHNAVLALGTGFSDDPTIRDLKTRLYFLEKAKSYIENECSRPHISVVNALSLIASFHSSQGDQTLGFIYFGMSSRVGQALGLRVDCGSWVGTVISEEDQMDRNWTYWTTYCQDVYWSFYVGREFCIPTTSKNVPIPFADADFDKLDWYHAPSGIPPQPGYMSKTFSSTCQLSMIIKNIMDVVCSSTVLQRRISQSSVPSLALHRWHDNLPEELKNTARMRSNPTPHLVQLHLTFHWSFILLHRPFYRRRSKSVINQDSVIDHAKICKRSADATMELLTIWRDYFTLRYVPVTLIQTIFGAGTIYLSSALQSVEGVRVANKELSHAMTKTLECIQYLKEAGESWPCATKIASILRDWQHQTKPKIRER
ncbi:hypothetical protein AGABI2DRAFT_209475, partial [Agaricus bisporus var. bisporus H97]|uniref:hypothetical protein n=1 Tax=Agaricus bisporus var. bisporus (strain H97 / ATCC MYA-4626 / FGSC 10389) TaxID=936046 RepID=UPI00029F658F